MFGKLVKKISVSGSRADPYLLEQDKVKWQEERDNLLMSRAIPKPDDMEEMDLFPQRKTEDELGPPIPLPPMTAIRLSFLNCQTLKNGEHTYPQLQLFCQSFCSGKPHCSVSENSKKAFEEAIVFGSDDKILQTKMLLVDWTDIPEDIDCIFIGVLFPKNSAKLLRGNIWFSATGMLEMLSMDDLDEDNWTRDSKDWPQWDLHYSPVRANLANEDMFKNAPEFFLKNSVFSTYLCDKELGYTQSYLWGK